MTTQELIESFLNSVCSGKLNQTRETYRAKLRYLATWLGDKPITQENINGFRAYIVDRPGSRLSAFSIRSILATARHFLGWAARMGYIQPASLVNIREPSPQPKAIDQPTIEKILAAAASTGQEWERARNTAILYVLRDTGARLGAVARLELGSVNLRAGVGIAGGKAGRLDTLHFSPSTVAAIRKWLSYRSQLNPADSLLWTGAKKTGLTGGGIYKVLARLARAAGVAGARFNPHSFRHAYARDFITNGGDLSQVSQTMGHSSIVVTAKYYSRWKMAELKKFSRKYSPGKDLPAPG